MANSKEKYPAWVQQYMKQGIDIREKDGHYYMYRLTSERIPGRKNPKAKRVYLGRITEDGGFIPVRRKLLEVSELQAYEYGLSCVLFQLSEPCGWRRACGDDWEKILVAVILGISPSSYLRKKYDFPMDEETLAKAKSQKALLFRRLKTSMDNKVTYLTQEEMDILAHVMLIELGDGKTVLSKIDDKEKAIVKKFDLRLEPTEVC